MTSKMGHPPGRKVALSFASTNFLYLFIQFLVFVYLPIYLKDIGFLPDRIGLLIGVYSFAMIPMIAPFGIISDKFSPKRLVQSGILLTTLWIIGLSFSRSFIGFFLSMIVGGAGLTMFTVSIQSLYYKHISDSSRGKKVGVFLMSGFLGFSLGPITGGFILRYYDMHALFIAGILLTLLLFILSTTIKDSYPIRSEFLEYKNDINKPEVILFLLLVMVLGTHFGVEQTNLPPLLKEKINLSSSQIGGVYGVVGIWLGALILVIGHIFDIKRNLFMLFFWGLVISGVFQALTPLAWSFGSVLAFRLFHTVGDGLVIMLNGIVMSTIFPNKRLGGNTGFLLAVRSVGVTTGALVCGSLNRVFSNYSVPFFLSGWALVILSLFLLSKRRIFRGVWQVKEKPVVVIESIQE